MCSLITTGPWSYSANNQLIGYDAVVYEYDVNGNTVKKTESGQATSYTYNARNRLERVYLPDGRVATYAYDPFGRRVKKQVGNSVTYFAYADEGLVGEYDATGSLQVAYGWKPDGLWGTDPLYRYAAGSYAFYHNDHLGTPQRLTAANDGAVVWAAEYAAFGLAVVDVASTVENNLRFAGQYADAESGLYYNFHRTYDPHSGRYTQVDPIGFAGGDLNLYRYVHNNPKALIDPFGLDWREYVKHFIKGAVSALNPDLIVTPLAEIALSKESFTTGVLLAVKDYNEEQALSGSFDFIDPPWASKNPYQALQELVNRLNNEKGCKVVK